MHSINDKNLKVLHLNARGFTQSKIDNFEAFLKSLQVIPDVICFTETWFDLNNQKQSNLTGYNSYHLVRTSRQHGGVTLYVKEQLNCHQIQDLSFINEDIEINTIKVNVNSIQFVICGIYRPRFKHDRVEVLINFYQI